LEEQDLKPIFNAIESGKCLAFLGTDSCTSYRKNDREDEPGLPDSKELAQWLAEKCQYTNGPIHDLSRIAEYFLQNVGGDRESLEKAIKEKIQIRCTPRPIHTVLSQLSTIKFIITSNYDTLIENELGQYGRQLTRHVHNPSNPRTGHYNGPKLNLNEKEIVLHKMHGSVDESGSMVITQSDYIRYLAFLHDEDRGMPEFFRKTILPECRLLFLGYSLEDWNFRVIWEGMLSKQTSLGTLKDTFALVKNPVPSVAKYWAKKNIEIFDCDLTEFAILLAKRYNLELPQFAIKKNEAPGTPSITTKRKERAKMDRPIKILFLAANPKDTEQLRLGEEVREIDEALLKAAYRDKFDLKQQWAVRVADLQEHLLRYQPDIVHFSGHGSAAKDIILEDKTGKSQPVSARALSNLFSTLKDNIRCVVLNACYSEPQAQAIAQHIDCVIGMSKAIGDESAISFAASFYQALGYGRNVKTAFDLGCGQIDLEGLDEQDTPKLIALHDKPEEIAFV